MSSRSPARKLLLGLVVAAGLLGGAELVLDLALPAASQATIDDEMVRSHVAQGHFAHHPELGWWWRRTPDWGAGINADGLRYGTLEKERKPGRLRAFALGNSQTYGAGLTSEQSWPLRTEAALRAAGVDAEIVNAGVPGYMSLQALRLVQTRLLDYDPTLLLVDCQAYDSAKETLAPRPVAWTDGLSAFLFESRIYYVLHYGWTLARPDGPVRMNAGSLRHAGMTQKETHGNHDRILELGRLAGVDVVFLDYPVWDPQTALPVPLAPPEDLPTGATVVEASKALLATHESVKKLFYDNNHLTPLGADVVGKEVARVILETRAGIPEPGK